MTMTRDEARAAWAASMMSVTHIGADDIKRLCDLIDEHCIGMGVINGTMRVDRGASDHRSIRLRSFYFNNREAVTFNRDGFIGFAGWADDVNVQPILVAFKQWVGETLVKKLGGLGSGCVNVLGAFSRARQQMNEAYVDLTDAYLELDRYVEDADIREALERGLIEPLKSVHFGPQAIWKLTADGLRLVDTFGTQRRAA